MEQSLSFSEIIELAKTYPFKAVEEYKKIADKSHFSKLEELMWNSDSEFERRLQAFAGLVIEACYDIFNEEHHWTRFYALEVVVSNGNLLELQDELQAAGLL